MAADAVYGRERVVHEQVRRLVARRLGREGAVAVHRVRTAAGVEVVVDRSRR
jgi:hypothetical protein